MTLCEGVYGLAGTFPASERYGLTGQLTRAVVSVHANIAEGHARGTKRDYAHFLAIAQGTLAETETYLLLAVRLKYLAPDDISAALSLLTEVAKMLSTMRTRLRS